MLIKYTNKDMNIINLSLVIWWIFGYCSISKVWRTSL